MPIRINLLAEAQALEELRRRDPVKRSIWVGGFLIFLVLLWAGLLQMKIWSAHSEQVRYAGQWTAMEKEVAAVRGEKKKVDDLARTVGTLTRLSTNRFLWGPALDALQHTVTEQIQMTRFHGEQGYIVVAAQPSVTQGGKKIPAKPASSTEKITFIIEGRDFADPSRRNYEAYIVKVTEYSYFKTNHVRTGLLTMAEPSSDAAEGARRGIQFSFECQFPEVQRDE